MNLDEIEELIRRYLAAGVTVVVILVAPATGGADEELTPSGEPSVVTIDPQRPDPSDTPDAEDGEIAGPDPADGPDLDPREPSDGPDDTTSDDTDTDADTDDTDDTDAEDPDTDGIDQDDTDRDDTDRDATADATSGDPTGDREEEPSGDHADEPAGDRDTGDPSATEPSPPEPTSTEDRTDENRPDGRAPDETETPDTGDGDGDSDSDSDDLEARGPADGSEPGIDDEAGSPPAARNPAAGEGSAPDTREATGSGLSGAATAAERYGWGTPDQEDDFTSGLAQWDLYDGPGHAGQGLRSPDAVTVQDGVLTITGDAAGTTGGMAWSTGQRYGRWEGRVRAPESDPSYNALLLLWPDADDFPDGGEIDFMEMLDPTRQRTEFFLHHGPDNEQVTAQVEIDGTQWHHWAVEWTPDEIVGYVDGVEWFRTTDTATFPPGPMHLCIQLDWFPDGAGEVRRSRMEVDWVRQYALEPADEEPADDQPDQPDQPDQEVASTEPASVAEAAPPHDDPLRRMFSWS
jgi:hypothetical protein